MSHELNSGIKPFLRLPFTDPGYRVYAGWFYSDTDLVAPGPPKYHFAIDFDLPRGSLVRAAAEGWAIASYHTFPKMEQGEDGQWRWRTYQGKTVNNGLGWHVFVYHPGKHLWTGYGHLEQGGLRIKPHAPRKLGENKYFPVGYKVDPRRLRFYPGARWVRQGEILGSVGDSGLGWGFVDYPNRPNPAQFPGWDKPHLHFEVFRRFGSRKGKHGYDPYGIYGEIDRYPDPSKPDLPMGMEGPSLWLTNTYGLPALAR